MPKKDPNLVTVALYLMGGRGRTVVPTRVGGGGPVLWNVPLVLTLSIQWGVGANMDCRACMGTDGYHV